MAKRSFKINSKALSAALGPTPKLTDGPARGTRIPERINAAIASDSAQVVQTSKGKGKGKHKKNTTNDGPPSKKPQSTIDTGVVGPIVEEPTNE